VSVPDESYPLAWPVGWPRARSAERSRFGDHSLYKARSQLEKELRLLGADHGAAVYFRVKGEPRVLACDRWDKVAHNFVALARHVEAIRGQLRWGVGSLEQAFGGYKALPAMGATKPWWQILGVSEGASIGQIDDARRELLRKHHPDVGGNSNQAAEINAAHAEGRRARA
jgi:hypothetical protein